jgi:hypothetical protein
MGQARGEQFTPNNVWASATPEGAEEELTLPSGQTCRARRMSIEGVIQSGLVEELDGLTATVDKYTREVKGGKGVPDGTPVISDDLLSDTSALTSIMKVVDALIPHIVVSPNVVPHWTERVVGKTKVWKAIPIADREIGKIYTDMIGLDDKMHLFDWALGGLAAFSSFRGESGSNVGNVAPREGAGRKAKRRSGSRTR